MYQHHIVIPTTLEKEFAEQLNAKRNAKYRQCLTWHVAHTKQAYLLFVVLKLKGHYQYFGITGNFASLDRVYLEIKRIWRKWLNRRSQKGSVGDGGRKLPSSTRPFCKIKLANPGENY